MSNFTSKFLDYTGLELFWNNLRDYIDSRISGSSDVLIGTVEEHQYGDILVDLSTDNAIEVYSREETYSKEEVNNLIETQIGVISTQLDNIINT